MVMQSGLCKAVCVLPSEKGFPFWGVLDAISDRQTLMTQWKQIAVGALLSMQVLRFSSYLKVIFQKDWSWVWQRMIVFFSLCWLIYILNKVKQMFYTGYSKPWPSL